MNEEKIEMNESVGVKKDFEITSRQEYVDSFFSLIPEAMNYMTSQNLQLAISSLEKALRKVKKDEAKERERIEREQREKEANKRYEALKKAEALKRKEEERQENLRIEKITSMDLPDDWTNFFSDDEVVSTTSVFEALDNSIENVGDVNIEYIAASVGKSVNDVIASLSDLIIQNPETWNECFYKGWELREDYFSGSLTQKLRVAKEANKKYKGYFKNNVKELEKLIPSFSSKDIYITLGSPWVPCEIIDEFIKYLIFKECEFDFNVANSVKVRHDDLSGTWKIENKNLPRKSVYQGQFRGFLFESYGTGRMDALTLLEDTLNMKTIKIVDKMEDSSGIRKEISIVNRNETLKILEKQEKLIKEFKDWVWQDERRMNTLISAYKETNSYGFCVKKHFDGSHLKFPGLNPNVTLYKHQRDAVKRIISTPNTLLAHDVGTGKTYTMIVSGMELKRLGKSDKNMYVVPNSILSQWKTAFEFLYPSADILVVDNSNFNIHKREETLSRIKNEDHDAILIAYSSFDLIPLSNKWYEEDLKRKIEELEKAERENQISMQRRINSLNKVLEKVCKEEKKNARSLSFDDLGINTLFLDEAHNYKNISYRTRIMGVLGAGGMGCERADGMLDKVHCIQRNNNGGRVVFATATPVTNSISDIYAMQKYLQEGSLRAMGISSFDAWAAMFADKVTDYEIDVDTNSYRLTTRFSRFCNLPELEAILSEVASFYQKGNILDLPEFNGYSDSYRDGSEEFKDFLSSISVRADDVRERRVPITEDNLLKITSDGRKAALDMRLIDEAFGLEPDSKVYRCAENIWNIYKETEKSRGTQLVFCDSSTPKEGFNLYDELKRILIAMGMREDEIAFIHDFSNKKKREVFEEKVNDGEIRVVLGSTFKLGTGVNLQTRLKAIHHLDVPWRPSDMVQREGRILRQGNTNDDVKIFRYMTRGSFDAYSWQLLESKERFISQILSSSVEGREAKDVSDAVLSYGEIKALVIGNPLMKTRIALSNEIDKLRLLMMEKNDMKRNLSAELSLIPEKIKEVEIELENLAEDKVTAQFSFVPLKAMKDYEKKAIRSAVWDGIKGYKKDKESVYLTEYSGFTLSIPPFMEYGENLTHKKPFITINGKGCYEIEIESELGIMKRLSNFFSSDGENKSGIEKYEETLRNQLKTYKNRITSINAALSEEDDYKERMEEMKKRMDEIDEELGINAE